MIYKILAVLILFFSVFLNFWPLVLILGLWFLLWYNNGLAPILAGFTYDLLYGLPQDWPKVILPFTLFFILAWFIWSLLKEYLFVSKH